MSGFSKTNEIYLYGDNDWSTTIKFHQVEEGEEGKYHGLPKGTNIMVFGNDEWEGGEECDMIKVTDEELKELNEGGKPKNLNNFDERLENFNTHSNEYHCNSCDYFLTEQEFDYGKGRIMYAEGEGIDEGEYRCGVCDPRCDDPDGVFPPNEESEDEEDKETHKDEVECVSCGVLFKETECTGTCATNEFGPFDKYLCEKCFTNGEVCFNCNLYFEAGMVIFCDTLEEGRCEKCWKNCGDKNCEGCLLHEE